MGRLMTTQNKVGQLDLKGLVDDKRTQDRFSQILGKKAPKFLSSLLSIANNNELLKKAEPITIINSALQAAVLDLPLNQNFGFAYIVPYQNKKENKVQGQFQMGYKGFIQLAMRSGQYLKINVAPLYEGQFISYDPIQDEIKYNLENKKSEEITHFIGYFKLLNGFEKYLVMSREEIENHAKKYSQSFKSGFGVWKDNFEAMATKTVIKLLLSRYGILSTELEQALATDQAVIVSSDKETNEAKEVIYVDTDNDNQYKDFITEEETKENIEEIETVEEVEEIEEIF